MPMLLTSLFLLAAAAGAPRLDRCTPTHGGAATLVRCEGENLTFDKLALNNQDVLPWALDDKEHKWVQFRIPGAVIVGSKSLIHYRGDPKGITFTIDDNSK
jgi:hypothetical protein